MGCPQMVLDHSVSSSLGPRPSQVVVCHSFHHKQITHVYCSCVCKHLIRKVMKGLPFMQLSHEPSRLSPLGPLSLRVIPEPISRRCLLAVPWPPSRSLHNLARPVESIAGYCFRGSMQGAATEPSLFYSRLNCKLQPPLGLTPVRMLSEKHTKPNRNDSKNCSS